VIAVLALMIAAGVGGFALSQYFVSLLDADRNRDRQEMRADLQAKLSEINATALRLEQARTSERKQIETDVQRADASRLGEEGVAASVVVAPCKPEGTPAKQPCTEQSALRVTLCARVPAAATVKEVQLYIRSEDSKQPWSESRVQAGQEAGEARFAEKFSERPEEGGAKQVCQGFANWSLQKFRLARIVVKYAL
jgi:hypothetical protein